jgi:hypothetical protein
MEDLVKYPTQKMIDKYNFVPLIFTSLGMTIIHKKFYIVVGQINEVLILLGYLTSATSSPQSTDPKIKNPLMAPDFVK